VRRISASLRRVAQARGLSARQLARPAVHRFGHRLALERFGALRSDHGPLASRLTAARPTGAGPPLRFVPALRSSRSPFPRAALASRCSARAAGGNCAALASGYKAIKSNNKSNRKSSRAPRGHFRIVQVCALWFIV